MIIEIILTLAFIGIILYLIESLPMDSTIKLLIRVVVIIFVIYYLLRLVGVADIPSLRIK